MSGAPETPNLPLCLRPGDKGCPLMENHGSVGNASLRIRLNKLSNMGITTRLLCLAFYFPAVSQGLAHVVRLCLRENQLSVKPVSRFWLAGAKPRLCNLVTLPTAAVAAEMTELKDD